MEKKEFVIETILNTDNDICFVLDSDLAMDVVLDLQETGIAFSNLDSKRLINLYRDNCVLSIDKTCHGGYDKYMITETLDEEGNTLREEVANFIFVDDDVAEIIDEDCFEGTIIIIEEYMEEFDEHEIETTECEEEYSVIDELIDETLALIESGNCPHCMLERLYGIAFRDGEKSLALFIGDRMNEIVEDEE